jgi:hypothetical protein
MRAYHDARSFEYQIHKPLFNVLGQKMTRTELRIKTHDKKKREGKLVGKKVKVEMI